MGQSVWTFLIRSKRDLAKVYELKDQHDQLSAHGVVGEPFETVYSMYYKGRWWLNLGNGGGSGATTDWLQVNVPSDMVVLWPFAKPSSWIQCKKVYFEKAEIDKK